MVLCCQQKYGEFIKKQGKKYGVKITTMCYTDDMIRRSVWLILAICMAFFAAITAYVYIKPTTTTTHSVSEHTSAAGRYVDYAPALLTDQRYDRTILYFARPGSDESDAFAATLAGNPLPDNTQFIRIDVDAYPELTKRYNVSVPPTFIRVNRLGQPLGTWVGYGHTKTVAEIIQQTR